MQTLSPYIFVVTKNTHTGYDNFYDSEVVYAGTHPLQAQNAVNNCEELDFTVWRDGKFFWGDHRKQEIHNFINSLVKM